MTTKDQVILTLRVLAKESAERMRIIKAVNKALREEAKNWGFDVTESGELIEQTKNKA